VLGKGGWEKIVALELSPEEQVLFAKSAAAVRAVNQTMVDMQLI